MHRAELSEIFSATTINARHGLIECLDHDPFNDPRLWGRSILDFRSVFPEVPRRTERRYPADNYPEAEE